jgi:DNA-directed RNA polymerase subunit F
MQDAWKYFLEHEILWGLGLGLLVTLFIWKSGMSAKLALKREVRRLQDELRDLQGHLNTQLKINASGNEKLNDEITRLREQNETLRVNLANLQNKPGRQEIRHLHIMEQALRSMQENAPGFAPAWEQAMRRAEADYEAGESGLKKLVRRILPGITTSASDHSDSDGDNIETVDFEKTKRA